MKAITLLGAAVMVAVATSAQATLVDVVSSGSMTVNTAIPDGNPGGASVDDVVSGVTDVGAIANVIVSLNISGGYNGDLVGYLIYQPTGGGSVVEAQLLNRPGVGLGGGAIQNAFGYSTAGMNVTLNDITTLSSINATQTPTGGGTYNSSSGTLNSTFNGVSTANGTWTLFLADMAQGDGSGTLNSWSLTVEEVPEPVTWALIIFGVLSVPVVLLKRKPQSAAK